MRMLSYWDEAWKPIEGFEWGYWVSDFGRVRGPRKMLTEINNGKGYLTVKLYKRRSTRPYNTQISRLVAAAFLDIPGPVNEYEVHHKDGNPGNNHVNNLEWVHPANHSRAGVRCEPGVFR